jgi:hypothetical protein
MTAEGCCSNCQRELIIGDRQQEHTQVMSYLHARCCYIPIQRRHPAVLYGLVPIAIPIPVFLLGLFTSGIQALVFATLTGAYLGESIECLLE